MSRHIELDGKKYLVALPRKKADGTWNVLAFRLKKNEHGKEIPSTKEVRDPKILHRLGEILVQLRGERL